MPTQADVKAQLKREIAIVESNNPQPEGGGRRTIKDMLEDPVRQREIAKALPNALTPERFTRIILNAVNDKPNLMRCDAFSLLAAAMQCAALGLEPNTPLGSIYLLPFENRREGRFDVQIVLGYRGIVDLALRSDRVMSVEARPVYQMDEFEIDMGTADKLVHVPYLDDKPGPVRFYYGMVRFAGGGHYYRPVPLWEIDEHRQASKAKDSPAWSNWERAMSLKTCVRIMAPYMPLSPEAARGIQADESTPQYDEFFGADGQPIDVESTEVTATPPVVASICETCGNDGDHEPGCPDQAATSSADTPA